MRYGKRSIFHPQGRPWTPQAHRERRLGCGHGETGQENHGDALFPFPFRIASVMPLSSCHYFFRLFLLCNPLLVSSHWICLWLSNSILMSPFFGYSFSKSDTKT